MGKYCSSILTMSVSDASVCMLYGRYLFFSGVRVDFFGLQAIQESSAVTCLIFETC